MSNNPVIPNRIESKKDFVLKATLLLQSAQSFGLTPTSVLALTRTCQVMGLTVLNKGAKRIRDDTLQLFRDWESFSEGVDLAFQQGCETVVLREDIYQRTERLLKTYEKLVPLLSQREFFESIRMVDDVIFGMVGQITDGQPMMLPSDDKIMQVVEKNAVHALEHQGIAIDNTPREKEIQE